MEYTARYGNMWPVNQWHSGVDYDNQWLSFACKMENHCSHCCCVECNLPCCSCKVAYALELPHAELSAQAHNVCLEEGELSSVS